MLTLIKDVSHPNLLYKVLLVLSVFCRVRMVLCMREGLIVFYFSFVEDDGGEMLYRDSIEV